MLQISLHCANTQLWKPQINALGVPYGHLILEKQYRMDFPSVTKPTYECILLNILGAASYFV